MLVETAMALAMGFVSMIVVGTVVRQMLGLRSAINWFVQSAVCAGIATSMAFGTVATVAVITLPTVIHGTRFLLTFIFHYRAKNGHYGEDEKWVYELMVEEQDQMFVHAITALPENEKMELKVIADSKQELRDLTIDRFDELSEGQELSETEFYNKL